MGERTKEIIKELWCDVCGLEMDDRNAHYTLESKHLVQNGALHLCSNRCLAVASMRLFKLGTSIHAMERRCPAPDVEREKLLGDLEVEFQSLAESIVQP